jgi:hypothetical protein
MLKILTDGFVREEAYTKLRSSYLESEKALEASRKRLRALEAEAADRERELIAAKTDCQYLSYLAEVQRWLYLTWVS